MDTSINEQTILESQNGGGGGVGGIINGGSLMNGVKSENGNSQQFSSTMICEPSQGGANAGGDGQNANGADNNMQNNSNTYH